MFNFSWVRMDGALKIHLHHILISSNTIKKFFESVIVVSENVKTFYLLYSTEELMIRAAKTMSAARMERAETEQQFIIPSPS